MFKGIQENDLELVRFYLSSGIDPNYQHPEYLALPLCESIRYGHLEIAKLLLEYGADPKIREMESNSNPLDLAWKMNKTAFVELLGS